jgi:hypothetical protein
VVGREGRREQEVREPVRPGQEQRVDRLGMVKGNELPLGPARDRPGDMEGAGRRRAARQDERGDRTLATGEGVDLFLEAVDVPLGDRRGRSGRAGSAGELGLDDEQLVAEPLDQRPDLPERFR